MARKKRKTTEEFQQSDEALNKLIFYDENDQPTSELPKPLDIEVTEGPSTQEILMSVIERLEMAYRISRDRKVNEILFNQLEKLKKLL